VTVVAGRNLAPKDKSGTSDPFVKVYLDGKKNTQNQDDHEESESELE